MKWKNIYFIVQKCLERRFHRNAETGTHGTLHDRDALLGNADLLLEGLGVVGSDDSQRADLADLLRPFLHQGAALGQAGEADRQLSAALGLAAAGRAGWHGLQAEAHLALLVAQEGAVDQAIVL